MDSYNTDFAQHSQTPRLTGKRDDEASILSPNKELDPGPISRKAAADSAAGRAPGESGRSETDTVCNTLLNRHLSLLKHFFQVQVRPKRFQIGARAQGHGHQPRHRRLSVAADETWIVTDGVRRFRVVEAPMLTGPGTCCRGVESQGP